ncbi:hypothetical protein HHK36_003566 [Tetracentron sinense]|uniref:Uncharacterized protein n=1 Tax=Tetracentron sinense TaxID=13715 RepID=A0A834ZRD6_TETSI|nr:hypothetical protein HHK36_003566 [Tetracentron sinense]
MVLGCYTSIFSFGDSLTDTGNVLHGHASKAANFRRLPYGETYFRRPTGRCSDGRLIIDFIAQSLGLPLVPPYLERSSGQNPRKGVNFAVVGATAVNASFYEERGIYNDFTNYSLGIQVGWFKELLPSLCNTSSSNSHNSVLYGRLDCHEFLRSSLILLGEIGSNDYNHPFLERRSIEEIRSFVPLVIHTISSAIKTLIGHGAVTLIIPGTLPLGCVGAFLAVLESPNKEDYDPQTGCLKWLNKFAEYHNSKLQIELDRIRELHPHVTIIYADYYNAAMPLYRSPDLFGFSKGALISCCGGGGRYNFNPSLKCGFEGANVCDDPSLYVNWDGLHPTEAAYKWIATALLQGPYTIPHIHTSCLSIVVNTTEHSHFE